MIRATLAVTLGLTCLANESLGNRAESNNLEGPVACFGYGSPARCNSVEDEFFIEISTGYAHSIGLKDDGTAIGWGSNSEGQLEIPVGEKFISVIAAYQHSAALKADGSVLCWGNNDYGQCDVPSGLSFKQISTGWYHTVGLTTEGVAICWGMPDVCNVPLGETFTHVYADATVSLGIRVDGTAVCWGIPAGGGGPGGPGGGGGGGSKYGGGCDIPSNEVFTKIAFSQGGSLCLRPDGTILCVGNWAGCDEPPLGGGFIDVATGLNFSAALHSSGAIVCWGITFGICNTVPGQDRFIKISAAGDTLEAIRDLSSYCCGDSSSDPICDTLFDCDQDGLSDICEIENGSAVDLNENGIDDACDPDCDADGVPDFQEIENGDFDCDQNTIPDSCQITSDPSLDLNGNTFIDACEIDCNKNDIFDFLDTYSGLSQDINVNGVPDECEDCDGDGIPDDSDTDPDCDGNGTPDTCEQLEDCNYNGIPDICEGLPGDCGCLADVVPNGAVDYSDLITVISNWGPCEPPCPSDIVADGIVGYEDLLQVLAAWGPCSG